MNMRGGALPWVLTLLTILAILMMFALVDDPEKETLPGHGDRGASLILPELEPHALV